MSALPLWRVGTPEWTKSLSQRQWEHLRDHCPGQPSLESVAALRRQQLATGVASCPVCVEIATALGIEPTTPARGRVEDNTRRRKRKLE